MLTTKTPPRFAAMKAIQSLGPIDFKNIQRDPLLCWMPFAPFLIAFLARDFVPFLLQRAETALEIEMMPYYAPLMGYVVIILTPILVGAVIGFLLLDQRDDHTLEALQVTPLSLNGYLAYRLAMPMLVSAVFTLAALPISGLAKTGAGEPLTFGALLACILCAAPLAPLFALAFAVFAQNKVQGFALQKASGVIFLPPVIAYFIHSNWRWLLGLFPTYWPGQVFWALQNGDPNVWLYLLIGLAYQVLLLGLLLQRFNQQAS